jgi:hypothetical protein
VRHTEGGDHVIRTVALALASGLTGAVTALAVARSRQRRHTAWIRATRAQRAATQRSLWARSGDAHRHVHGDRLTRPGEGRLPW